MEAATKAEEELLDSELSSIELCEELLSATKSPTSPSSFSPPKDSSVFPNWFERPGAPEVVETRADLNDRYNRLRAKMVGLKDEGKELLGKVESYEEESGKFKSWLVEKKDTLESLAPPCSSVEEIKKQLKQVQVNACSAVRMEMTFTVYMCTYNYVHEPCEASQHVVWSSNIMTYYVQYMYITFT